MSTTLAATAPATAQRRRNYARQYWPFIVPAGAVVAAVILFPWVFTLYMSVHDWHIGGARTFAGLANYQRMLTDERFLLATVRTLYFTALSVILPVLLGVLAAVVFHRQFPGRGLLRTVFILPMMATPVAIALVWTMMFHPQLGVLNYLLTSVGLPPSTWVYAADTVIPTLVMVETWQWTPLVMLIVLGGLASLPTDPYEAAMLDGASGWQVFRHVTLPLARPGITVATILAFIFSWNNFIFGVVLAGRETRTLPVAVYNVLTFEQVSWGPLAAAALLVTAPVLLLTLLMQREIVAGLTAGGVKGG